jgi:hypothetical protein
MTPRKINSSNKTDLIFHQMASNIRLIVREGFICHCSLAKYIREKKPVEQQIAVIKKNRMKSNNLRFVG